MYHRNYTTYIQKELDFLKLLVSRFHEQEHVNDLELGVAMQRTQEIYEHFLKMKLMPEAVAKENPVTFPQLVETLKTEKRITETEQQPIIEQPPAPSPALPPQAEPPPKATILAEKLSSSDFIPINETLAQQVAVGGDLSSKLQTAPLASIASGIGLNDRFLYTRELFKDDRDLYDSAIKYLDSVDSLEEALDFIRRNFKWDRKSETTQKFVNLLYRRHGGN